MNRRALKDIIYGGIVSLMDNRDYYYNSPIGAGYSHWTEEGRAVLSDFISTIAPSIVEVEEEELNKRAKQLVMNNLKGENN